MDKSGIFTLLSSLFSPTNKTEQNKSDSVSDEKSTDKTDKKSTDKPPSDYILTEQNIPLQYSMIKTMTSHDEFIKRVLNNNQK